MRYDDAKLIQLLDEIESDMRRLEYRVHAVRAQLRERVDPHHRRRDLGYWPDQDTGELRPRVVRS